MCQVGPSISGEASTHSDCTKSCDSRVLKTLSEQMSALRCMAEQVGAKPCSSNTYTTTTTTSTTTTTTTTTRQMAREMCVTTTRTMMGLKTAQTTAHMWPTLTRLIPTTTEWETSAKMIVMGTVSWMRRMRALATTASLQQTSEDWCPCLSRGPVTRCGSSGMRARRLFRGLTANQVRDLICFYQRIQTYIVKLRSRSHSRSHSGPDLDLDLDKIPGPELTLNLVCHPPPPPTNFS